MEEILLHFTKSMTEIDSEEDLLWDLVSNCISKLNFEDAVVYVLDPVEQVLIQKAALGPKSGTGREIINSIKIPFGKGITGKVVTSGLPILIPDTREHPDYIMDDEFRLSEVAVPILLEGKVIGVIDSEHSQIGYFNDQHVRILNAVASIYAGQIARIRAEKKAKNEQEQRLELQRRNYQFQLAALSAQLSPHFVFNSLNSIQHQIFKDDKENSLRFLSTFSKLLRYFLNQLQSETARLKEEIQMIQWYLELQQLRYGKSLKFSISTSDSLPIESARIPSLVLQNLIENLLEEQIRQSNGTISILVNVWMEGNDILVQVSINQSPAAVNGSKSAHVVPPWEDFIRLINEIRAYAIRYEVTEQPCPGLQENCKSVSVLFPNLSRS